jgi:hypothetical protein
MREEGVEVSSITTCGTGDCVIAGGIAGGDAGREIPRAGPRADWPGGPAIPCKSARSGTDFCGRARVRADARASALRGGDPGGGAFVSRSFFRTSEDDGDIKRREPRRASELAEWKRFLGPLTSRACALRRCRTLVFTCMRLYERGEIDVVAVEASSCRVMRWAGPVLRVWSPASASACGRDDGR